MENNSPGKHSRRVQRCLFGKPDPNQVEKWLSDATEKQLKNGREKWNYDFKLDKPISGDIEYEVVPVHKVPSVYKPAAYGKKKARRVAEFDPNIPSASSEEAKSEPDVVAHRPLTRSCTKQQDDSNTESSRSLKQAKLTNYLKVRKRRSHDRHAPKSAKTSLKSLQSAPPSSPFRFAAADVESGDASDSATSASCSPPKSPRKRPAQKSSTLTSPRLPKLRSHTGTNQ